MTIFFEPPFLNPPKSINCFEYVFGRSELTLTVTMARYSSLNVAPRDHSNKFKKFSSACTEKKPGIVDKLVVHFLQTFLVKK